MSCKVKIKTLDYLKEKDILTSDRQIQDLYLFNKQNERLTNLALSKYGVGNGKDLLFSSVNKRTKLLDGSFVNITRAEPNDGLFNLLDEVVDNDTDVSEEVLYNLDEETEEVPLEVLNKLNNFIEAVGITVNLTSGIKDSEGNINPNAIASANFSDATINILDNLDSRREAWNSLPEEVAHFYYEMLVDFDFKEELTAFVQKNPEEYNKKVEELLELGYTEKTALKEIIGKAIAEEMKRPTLSEEFRAIYERIVAFFKELVSTFKATEEDDSYSPVSVAAERILNSDLTHLMSIDKLKDLYKDYNKFDIVESNNYEKVEPSESIQIQDTNWYKNLHKRFKIRSKFMPKTIKKLEDTLHSLGLSSTTINKKDLTPSQLKQLAKANNYKTLVPELKSYKELRDKYKKGISLKSPIKLNGKKQDLEILNTVREMLLDELPSSFKTISPSDFIRETEIYLSYIYKLGFAEEQEHLGYRIDQTFKHNYEAEVIRDYETADIIYDATLNYLRDNDVTQMPSDEELRRMNQSQLAAYATYFEVSHITADIETRHRKISLRFNNQYIDQNSHFNLSPSAWGNITYFRTNENTQTKDAVLIHEIQNDFIEKLQNSKENNSGIKELENQKLFQSMVDHMRLPSIFRVLKPNSSFAEFKERIQEQINLESGRLLVEERIELYNGLVDGAYTALTTLNWNLKRLSNDEILEDFNFDEFIKEFGKGGRANGQWSLDTLHDKLAHHQNDKLNLWKGAFGAPGAQLLYKGKLKSKKQLGLLIRKALIKNQLSKIHELKADRQKVYNKLSKISSLEKYDQLNEIEYTDLLKAINSNVDLTKNYNIKGLSTTTNNAKLSKDILVEKSYFNPLVHQLIQTIIKEKGKDFPIYFSGYEITKLTQGSEKTAAIYAGPEEISIIQQKTDSLPEGYAKRSQYTSNPKKVGPLYVAMSKIPGITIDYVEDIPGFRTEVGGYKVNVSKYEYTTPVLFSLKNKKSKKKVQEAKLDELVSEGAPEIFKASEETKTEPKSKIEADPYTHLDTLQDKMDNAMDKIEENLKLNISKLSSIAKRTESTNPKKAKKQLKYVNHLKDTLEVISDYRDTERVRSLILFLNTMDSALFTIKTRLEDLDYSSKEQITNIVYRYETWLTTFSVIKDISKTLSEIKADKEQTLVTKSEIEELEKLIRESQGSYTSLKNDIEVMIKKSLSQYLNDIRFFPEIEKNHYNKLSKDFDNAKLKVNKKQWVIKRMAHPEYKLLIDADIEKKITDLLENPSYDIYGSDVALNSAINVSNPLISILNRILTDINNERITTEREKDVKFKKLFEALVESKGGTFDIRKLYENILEKDSEGKSYLKGEYSIKLFNEVILPVRNLRKELRKKIEAFQKQADLLDVNDPKQQYISDSINNLRVEYNPKINKLLKDNFIYKKRKIVGAKAKWKQDLSNLSKEEKDVLNLFKEITDFTNKETFAQGRNSLITFTHSIKFYELPKITKTSAERVWGGEATSIVKDKWRDLTEVRPDDVGYLHQDTDLEGKDLKSLRIHYRDLNGKFKNADQSLDLFSIYRLEYKNGNMYKIRKDSEVALNFLVSIAKNKQYYEKRGTSNIKRKSTKKYNLVEGANSNVHKMMVNLMETKFYDIMNKGQYKINQLDVNKVVDFLNNSTAFLTLSLNIASGTANVVNAKAQLFLESFIKGRFIKAAGIKKANMIYGKHLGGSLRDITSPIDRSLPNQISEMFNVQGYFNLSESNFLKSSAIKKGLSTESLQIFQNSGEHWIQSVITMSVLDGVKVMNENHDFIDKEGNIVEEDNAASILDMIEQDPNTGLASVNSKVVYTTHSKLTKWNENGKTNIDLLINKKIIDSIGNFRQTDQPDLMRNWYGKLFLLFRKYFVSMGVARLRNFENSLFDKEDLRPDQMRFNEATQEFEEGTYVSLIRFLKTALYNHKATLLKTDWENLTDYEKHNIKRATIELLMTTIMLPLSVKFVAGVAAGDDNEYLFFLAYQLKRLDTELAAYRNPSDMFKMMRSPIPSARILETGISIFSQLLTPWTLDDKYEGGTNKGRNKFTVRLLKQMPVVKEFQRTYQDLFEFQNRPFGGGF
jgi:3-methyladenine DNA glycosylase AlkC